MGYMQVHVRYRFEFLFANVLGCFAIFSSQNIGTWLLPTMLNISRFRQRNLPKSEFLQLNSNSNL